MKSIRLLGAAVLGGVVLWGGTAPTLAAPTLTDGTWTITGVDIAGTSWTGSTIKFETESPSGSDYAVSGYFYWTGNGGADFGRENFSGILFPSDHLTLQGIGLVPPTSGIVTGATYDADVTSDGHHLIHGTWGGTGIPSEAWTAVQADPPTVPEPATLLLLAFGVPPLAVVAYRRHKAAR
jgi:hypothetical protein